MIPNLSQRSYLRGTILVLASFACACSGHGQTQAGGAAQRGDLAAPIFVDHGANSAAARAKPYVILVSLDGFRYDYTREYSAPNISALGARGASAPGAAACNPPVGACPLRASPVKNRRSEGCFRSVSKNGERGASAPRFRHSLGG